MTRPAEPSKVVLWVVLSIVGLFVLGIGACAVCIFTNPDIKKVIGQVRQMESRGEAAEEIRTALEKFVTTKNKWPESLADLDNDLSPSARAVARDNYEYKKPVENDPADVIVVWTKNGESSRLLDYRIEIDKSFRGYIVTRQPLDQRGGSIVTADPSESKG